MPIKTLDTKKEKISAKKSSISNNSVENEFVKKLNKALATKEVELSDGQIVSNMDAIIDNLIGKAIDGDRESIKLIKELSNK